MMLKSDSAAGEILMSWLGVQGVELTRAAAAEELRRRRRGVRDLSLEKVMGGRRNYWVWRGAWDKECVWDLATGTFYCNKTLTFVLL